MSKEEPAIITHAREVCRLTEEESDWQAISAAIAVMAEALKKLDKQVGA